MRKGREGEIRERERVQTTQQSVMLLCAVAVKTKCAHRQCDKPLFIEREAIAFSIKLITHTYIMNYRRHSAGIIQTLSQRSLTKKKRFQEPTDLISPWCIPLADCHNKVLHFIIVIQCLHAWTEVKPRWLAVKVRGVG